MVANNETIQPTLLSPSTVPSLFFFPSFGEQISRRIYTRTNMATSCAHESTCRYTGVTLHFARVMLSYARALFRERNTVNKILCSLILLQFSCSLIFLLTYLISFSVKNNSTTAIQTKITDRKSVV